MNAGMATPFGARGYGAAFLAVTAVVAVGLYCYLQQLDEGLGVTGLGRDVSWGLYIGQFAYAEGLAGAAIIVLLPYYVHGSSELNRIALFAMPLVVAAIVVAMLFIVVDLGQPARVFNVMLHPTPWSPMFWDMVSLGGYLFLNVVIALGLLSARRLGIDRYNWLPPIIIVSLVWGIAVHTVSASLVSGLAARPYWNTAIVAPRFLASALATGSATLILIFLMLRRLGGFDAGRPALNALATTLTYALAFGLFLMLVEVFTAAYSGVPEEADALAFLYFGLSGHSALPLIMWASLVVLLFAFFILLIPKFRAREPLLVVASIFTLVGIWLDKGFAFVVAGFVPSPLGAVPNYVPSPREWAIVAGTWGIGALIVMVSYRVVLRTEEILS